MRTRTLSFVIAAIVATYAVAPQALAQNGGAEATFQRGVRVYQSGDKAGALAIFIEAANAGSRKGAVQAGWQYEFGEGVPRNAAQAARWYRKGAEMGDSRGQKNLGAMYEDGRGVPEDWIEAANWYRKSAAQGDPEGQTALSRAYQFGIGVPQSRAEAIRYARLAAAQGDEDSAYYARWLSDPTNNIGFRNVQERNLVIGYRMVDVIVQNEPSGVTFRNAAERTSYLVGVARRLDADMAYARWWQKQGDYTRCQATRRSGCMDPGPPPR